MQHPLVSIIVPLFNSSKTIERCIQSIKAQTIENWELLLVDNGSKDNSYELIQKFANDDERVHALQELKSGVSYARNTALNSATGDFICFVDSDDTVEPDYLEHLLDHPDADLTICGYFVDTEKTDGEKIKTEQCISPEISWYNGQSKSALIPAFENGFMHLCCNKLFRRRIIETNHIRFQHYPVNEDFIFALTFLQHAKSVRISDCALYHWIRVAGQTSGVKSIPENLLEIYNQSHILTRDFFADNQIADRISYLSYELIMYKYYEAYQQHRLGKKEMVKRLANLHRNELVSASYNAHIPTTRGEKLLHILAKHGWFRMHYILTQKILKFI